MISEQSKTTGIFDLDDDKLIEKFVQGSNQLLVSDNLRLEVSGVLSQLTTRMGEPIAIMYLQTKPRTVIIKQSSPFYELIASQSIEQDFVMFGDANRPGFIEYRHYVTPAGYRISYTDPSILWKKWWPTERFQDKQRFNMEILVSYKGGWYPVQKIDLNAGTFTISTIAGKLTLKRDNKVLWLAHKQQDSQSSNSELFTSVTERSSLRTGAYAPSSTAELATKIHQKQSGDSERLRATIQQLEEKLQAQVDLNRELEEKTLELNSRTTIAEQRLQMVHKYLHKIGIDPQDIYQQNLH